jgi:hypothetical protein
LLINATGSTRFAHCGCCERRSIPPTLQSPDTP